MEQNDILDKKGAYVPHRSYVNQYLTSFPSFDELSSYYSLSFAGNPISSLETLPSLPSLKILNLNGTEIESFYGVSVQPSLEKLFIKNTPISYFHDVRIMCIAAFGPTLKFINNDSLTTYEIKMGNCFYNALNSYLKRGWIISGFYPVKLVNLRTHERRIVDVKLPVISLRTYACVPNYETKCSLANCFPDLLNTIPSNTESFSIKTPFKTRRRCTLNTSYIEPIPSYLPKGIEKISQMTPEELKKAVKKCLCIQEKKKEEAKTARKKKPIVRLRKRKQNERFFDTPETKYLREQDNATKPENIENNVDMSLKLDNYEKEIEEIPLMEDIPDDKEEKSPKIFHNNMQKYFDKLKSLGPMEKPSQFIYNNIPASSSSTTSSSTSSVSSASSTFDIISDAALDKQLTEINSKVSDLNSSDLFSFSDLNFDSSYSMFSSGVDDYTFPKQSKKGKQRRQANNRKTAYDSQPFDPNEIIEIPIDDQTI